MWGELTHARPVVNTPRAVPEARGRPASRTAAVGTSRRPAAGVPGAARGPARDHASAM